MRKIINSTYVTLDGIIQNPQNWPSLGSFDEAGYAVQNELLEHCDAIVMGRLTYEVFAPAWSAMSGDPISDRMNALPKFVVSSTLGEPTWTNTTVISDDPMGTIREMKVRSGADIVQYGFGPVARALMGEGLLDELRLWVHPFILGTGTPDDLLYRSGSAGSFELTDTTTLPSGVIIARYSATGGDGAEEND